MEEEIIQKIYKLTNELALQQQNNQDLTTNLTCQLNDLKSKTNTKYSQDDGDIQIPNPLLPEQRDEVIMKLKDRLDKALREQEATQLANKQLENEVKELQVLVKDYESGLEVVTSKLRVHASASTEGQVRLRREYEALLNAEKGTTAALFIENTMLQSQLLKLSQCLREVYKDEAIDSREQEIAQLKRENQELLNLLKISSNQDACIILEKSSPKLRTTGVIEEFFTDTQ